MKKAGTFYLYATALFMLGQAAYSAVVQEVGPNGWIGPIVGGIALFIVAQKTRNL